VEGLILIASASDLWLQSTSSDFKGICEWEEFTSLGKSQLCRVKLLGNSLNF